MSSWGMKGNEKELPIPSFLGEKLTTASSFCFLVSDAMIPLKKGWLFGFWPFSLAGVAGWSTDSKWWCCWAETCQINKGRVEVIVVVVVVVLVLLVFLFFLLLMMLMMMDDRWWMIDAGCWMMGDDYGWSMRSIICSVVLLIILFFLECCNSCHCLFFFLLFALVALVSTMRWPLMAINTLSSAQLVGNLPLQWENPTLGAAGGVMAIKALHDGYQKIPVDDKVRSGDIFFFF